ncbi:MAG: hypothetical protein NDI90_16050 [Nitrospira sp. BO4]|nr:hypothetical protein [Nitrospira sp. BO4]
MPLAPLAADRPARRPSTASMPSGSGRPGYITDAICSGNLGSNWGALAGPAAHAKRSASSAITWARAESSVNSGLAPAGAAGAPVAF